MEEALDTSIDYVFTAANEILQTISDVFVEAGHELPNRQYVIAGTPAFDCEQVTVAFMSMANGLPNGDSPPMQCDNPRNGTFIIDIVRKLPQGKGSKSSAPIVPTPQMIMETSRTQMRDAKLLADVCERYILNNFIPKVGGYSIVVAEAAGFYQTVSAELLIAV